MILKRLYIIIICWVLFGVSLAKARDPFSLSSSEKPRQRTVKAQIMGIIDCDGRIGALIMHRNKSKMMFVGDKVQGYRINHIAHNNVELKKGKTVKKLLLK